MAAANHNRKGRRAKFLHNVKELFQRNAEKRKQASDTAPKPEQQEAPILKEEATKAKSDTPNVNESSDS